MSGCGASAAIVESQPDMTLDQVRERMAPHQARVTELLRRYPVKRAALLQALWLVQEEFGWVPRIAMKWAAEVCDVSPVHAFSVVEFYTMYKQVPPARWHIRVCHNVSCHIQGAEDLIAKLEEHLGITAGEHTEDGLFALERVECLAACGNGPAMQIDDEFLDGPDGFNNIKGGWHPGFEDVEKVIAKLRAEAKENPNPGRMNPDQLGGIMLDTAGHPGAPAASAQVLDPSYAPAPPPVNVKVTGEGEKITVSGKVAPEVVKAVIERSDSGESWKTIAEIDPKTIPGPPGPRTVTAEDTLAIGSTADYRVVAHTADRDPRASSRVTHTAEPAADADESKEDS